MQMRTCTRVGGRVGGGGGGGGGAGAGGAHLLLRGVVELAYGAYDAATVPENAIINRMGVKPLNSRFETCIAPT